jgi:hypothetical protein
MFYWRGGHRRLAELGELYSKSGGNWAVIREKLSSQNALSEKIGQGVFVCRGRRAACKDLTKTHPTRLPLQGIFVSARAVATALCAVSGILCRIHLTGHRPVATVESERAFLFLLYLGSALLALDFR